MQHRRLVVAGVVLLVFRAVTRGSRALSGGLQRARELADPVGTDIVVLWGVLFGESVEAAVWFVEPVAVGILYLSVFFLTIRAIYPDSLWKALDTAGVRRAFEVVISLHILAVFLSYRLLRADLGVLVFGDVLGIPLNILFVLYFAMVVPLSIGYVLSITEGGLFSEPDPESSTFALIQGFSANAEPAESDDLEGPVSYWLFQGLVHAIPVLILGGLFVGYDLVFPTIELLLAVGIVATLSPWRAVPPGDVRRYDIEARLATVLKFTTVNAKGFSTAFVVVFGLLSAGLVLVLLAPVVVSEPAPGPGVVADWNRLGFALALGTFASVSVLWWLSIGDRLGQFISAWTDRYDTFEGRTFPVDEPLSPRFPVGLGLPAGWLALSLVFVYSTLPTTSALYALMWPVLGVACVVLYTRGDPDTPPLSDNVAIAQTIAIQLAFVPLALSVATLSDPLTATGLLSLTPLFGVLLVVFPVALVGFYLTADGFHRLNRRSRGSARGERQKLRFVARGVLYFGSMAMLLVVWFLQFGNLPLPMLYAFGAFVVALGIVSQLDPVRFKDDEWTTRATASFLLVCSVFVVGLGLSMYVDSGRPMLPPRQVIVVGLLGLVVAVSLLGYDWARAY